jgi:hypothetical protein
MSRPSRSLNSAIDHDHDHDGHEKNDSDNGD